VVLCGVTCETFNQHIFRNANSIYLDINRFKFIFNLFPPVVAVHSQAALQLKKINLLTPSEFALPIEVQLTYLSSLWGNAPHPIYKILKKCMNGHEIMHVRPWHNMSIKAIQKVNRFIKLDIIIKAVHPKRRIL
jgi:hypothetical protein